MLFVKVGPADCLISHYDSGLRLGTKAYPVVDVEKITP
jgi:hypothetical protein